MEELDVMSTAELKALAVKLIESLSDEKIEAALELLNNK